MASLLRSLPHDQRPRERLIALGPDALTTAELLALVLGTGGSSDDALALAQSTLARFDGLEGLARARHEELCRVPGLGAAKAAAIVGAMRLAAGAAPAPSPVIHGPDDIARLAQRSLRHLRRERVLVLVCNARNRVLHTVVVSEGAADRALFPVREILNAVLRHDGRSFAVAHNHPGGSVAPSTADRQATADLVAGAAAVGLRFLDHVVVTDTEWAVVPGAAAAATA